MELVAATTAALLVLAVLIADWLRANRPSGLLTLYQPRLEAAGRVFGTVVLGSFAVALYAASTGGHWILIALPAYILAGYIAARLLVAAADRLRRRS